MCYGCEKRLTNRPTNKMEQQSQKNEKERETKNDPSTDRYKHITTNAAIHKDMAIVFQFVVVVVALMYFNNTAAYACFRSMANNHSHFIRAILRLHRPFFLFSGFALCLFFLVHINYGANS